MADEIATLASRHLTGDRSIEEELVELGRLPADKRKAVETRLRVIDRYLARPKETKAQDAAVAAAQLGTSVRQFKHMIVKMREFGPVRGLAPHLTLKRQTAMARQGLAPEIEEVLTYVLAANPLARLSEASAAIATRCTELGLPLPTQYSIRQRLLERRSAARAASRVPFGTQLVLDQAKIDLPCSYEDFDGRLITSLPTLTLLIDAGTRIIAGYALQEHLFEDVGIARTILYFIDPVEGWLSGTDLPVAHNLAKITWIVPPDLEGFVDIAQRAARAGSLEVVARAKGPRRHGTEILKYLGDRLGPYRLFTRMPFGPEAPLVSAEGVSYERGAELIGYCVGAWNEARLRDQNAHPAFPADQRRRQIKKIIGDLEGVIEPVMDAVLERAVATSDDDA